MADPDWTNACAVLEWLRPQYYRVAAGQQTVTVKHGDDSVTYSMGSVDKLAALMQQLRSECAASQGATTGRRRAFTGG